MNSRRSHPPLAAAATRARRTRTQMRMWREGKKKSLAALALRGSGAARRGALLATTHAFKLYAPTRHPPRSWSPTRVRIPVAISRATPPPPPTGFSFLLLPLSLCRYWSTTTTTIARFPFRFLGRFAAAYVRHGETDPALRRKGWTTLSFFLPMLWCGARHSEGATPRCCKQAAS